MKKTYKAPQTEVVKINVEQMICDSPDGFAKALGTKGKAGGAALNKDDDFDSSDDLWQNLWFMINDSRYKIQDTRFMIQG